ncbi:MAG: tRNA pseudouridine(55) synthase TruB [Methyloceanibacter sp.]|uniref:tRNA pseudouridine(55) synthase TruB n=1 Tax=Methyloceanibacter sp. TaxID=1965321 RepID=UPI001DE4BA7A|nr:tRNA pseudouridine(55) synthase TruB [Methyloceanibacter sp.]MCB1441670.1 tRNA pseudouridine(55) synthase TruB [Methyloceanibacter sp.]
MGRRRKGQAVNGWLILDKPEGLTSTKAVGRTRWLYDAAKAGHAGTLDPLATGILPIAFGEATKTVPFAVDGAKTYRFTVRFGAETETDDTEGAVTQTSDKRPDPAEIEAALPRFTGDIQQVPPRFSALKVDGARAYDLARDREEFELPPRTVTIDRLEIVDIPDPDTCILEADCGKGTYVRALARDLGRALHCLGHISALRRTRVGGFTEDNAVTLADVEQAADEDRDALLALLKPVETALEDLPALSITAADAAKLRQGRSVLLRGRDAPIVTGPVYAVSKGSLVALGEVAQGEFRPSRVFNLAE